uniref:Reverse transcriptase domain-containing protein n=1 Tax=Tanacetum cinerariifolium TaxID=118510 RepID=A0A6L2KR44_TANCI|nr:hypothetical protein [Tanacetum cinerariifolium]
MHPVDLYVEAALQASEYAPPSLDYVSGPEHPPSPNYVPGLKEPEQELLSPNYVPEPEDPKYLAPFDAKAPIEDQPLPDDAPTALSSGYDADSDSKEDPEKEHEEDPANYPVDGGDNANDESSDDDDDDAQEAFEDDDEEDKDHQALSDPSAIHVDDLIPSAEDTKAFESDDSTPTPIPSPRRHTARMSVRRQILMSDTAEALITEYASAPTPPSPLPSPLSTLSSPLPHIPSPPLPLPSPPTTSLTYAEAPLGYRAAMIRLRATSLSTHHPSEIPSPPMAMTIVGVVNDRVTYLATTQRQDAQELYMRCEEAQDDQALLGAQAWSHFESRIQSMKAQIRALQRDVDVLQRQMIRDEDRLTAYIQHEHDRFKDLVRAAEAGPQDGLEDASSSCYMDLLSLFSYLKMPPKKRTATTTTTTTPMTDAQLKALITQGVANELAEHDADRSRNGDDSHDSGSDKRRRMPTVTHEVAYGMTWKASKKMMTNKYCLRNKIKKLEIELWNLKVKVTDVLSCNQCFQELVLMCDRMFPEESDEVKKYVSGLLDMIHESVIASKPKTMLDEIKFVTELMDQKIRTLAECQAENKRKFEDTLRNNQNQQQPFKRHNVARAYTAWPGEKKLYRGSKPLCPKCNYHRDGQCAPKEKPELQCCRSSLIDIIPTTLDHGYDIELPDGRII